MKQSRALVSEGSASMHSFTSQLMISHTCKSFYDMKRQNRSALQQRWYRQRKNTFGRHSLRRLPVATPYQRCCTLPMHATRLQADEVTSTHGWSHHQQWLDFVGDTSALVCALHTLEARHHGLDQVDGARWTSLQHRMHTAGYWQCTERHVGQQAWRYSSG